MSSSESEAMCDKTQFELSVCNLMPANLWQGTLSVDLKAHNAVILKIS